jgi:hypothetical protein
LRFLAKVFIDLKAILDRGDDAQIPAQVEVVPKCGKVLDGRFAVGIGGELK